jgi:hypothetical protein
MLMSLLMVTTLNSLPSYANGFELVSIAKQPSGEQKTLQMLDPNHPHLLTRGVALQLNLNHGWAFQISPEEINTQNRPNGLTTPKASLVYNFD